MFTRTVLFVCVSSLFFFANFGETSAQTPVLLWAGDMDENSLADWYYPETSATGDFGGGLFNSGVFDSTASNGNHRSGSYSLRATISTLTGTSGVRAFRWRESRGNRELYYSAWFLIPTNFTLTADPNTGQFWNLFQFKSRSTTGRNDPVWGFYADPNGAGGLSIRAGWGWGGTEQTGPYSTDDQSGKNYSQSIASIPVGQWVHFEGYLRQSNGFDGVVKFWQNGVLLFNFQNVRTSYNIPGYNAWNCCNEWSVNNYSDGISPDPSIIYIDDAAISQSSTFVAPLAPINLIATAISSNRIDLTWTDCGFGEVGYKIERRSGNGAWSQIGTKGGNVTSFSSTGLTRNRTYSYRVRAFNEVGDSVYSNVATAKTKP
jgi:hypothetical protein